MGTKRYDYDVEDIVSMYKSGAFCSDIAAKYGDVGGECELYPP